MNESATENESATNKASSTEKQVQLGCGTLILIALIVMIFSGADDVEELETSVVELQTAIEDLRTTVDRIEQKIDELALRAEAPPVPQ